jgi:S1-C subfamily serine protease
VTNTRQRRSSSAIRFLTLGLIIGLLAYWAGARWGKHTPESVHALPDPPTDSDTLTPDEQVNVQIYKEAAPAVANIVTKQVEYDFFLNPVPVEGAGSGFLIDAEGHILTNYHVVQNAQTIEVTLGNQERFKAKFLGADQRNDIALLSIDAGQRKITFLPLADSRAIQVGQKVLAIGNPFGFQSTLTTGVVSALGRTVQTSDTTFIDEAIQTDAAINKGNSGGPLLNTHGQAIGINSAIYAPNGTTAGIGFAIPINTARRVVNDLLTTGKVHRASLGIEGWPLWPELAHGLDLPVEQGFLIERVEPGGPADNAGIRGGTRTVLAGLRQLRIGGDVLVAIDGKPIASQLDMSIVLNRAEPGENVVLTIYRGQKKMDVRVTLGEL